MSSIFPVSGPHSFVIIRYYSYIYGISINTAYVVVKSEGCCSDKDVGTFKLCLMLTVYLVIDPSSAS